MCGCKHRGHTFCVLVLNKEEFKRCICRVLEFTEDSKAIVTLGIKPSRPETEYGYIAAGIEVMNDIGKVEAFKEKPDLETAQKYVAQGNFYWNAGIFVWNVQIITRTIEKYTPQIAEIIKQMASDFNTEKETETLKAYFPTCKKVSIDYAVIEKVECIHVLPAEFGWSDLENWDSLHGLLPQDEFENAKVGDNVKLFGCRNCLVHVTDERKVVLEGLDGLNVAEKDGIRLTEEQHIKEFSQE